VCLFTAKYRAKSKGHEAIYMILKALELAEAAGVGLCGRVENKQVIDFKGR
jgi:hypothetical protein